ncbi:MAG: hypothetical protein NVSMB1_11030 [Polyangiales bacterium]
MTAPTKLPSHSFGLLGLLALLPPLALNACAQELSAKVPEDAWSLDSSETSDDGSWDPPVEGSTDVSTSDAVGEIRGGDSVSDVAAGADFSFVVVGCNRIEKGDVSSTNPSTANVEQLTRTFSDVAALKPPPKFFFFAGDMVLGYSDEAALEVELKAWVALYNASPLPSLGVELVAIPGNHEMQAKVGSSKLAYLAAETTWVKVMGPYIKASNGPKAAGLDALMTDQSRLTYSFDYQTSHFVILNTDPVGKDWQVPVQWVSNDVTLAHAAGAKHIFAIGHKPAYASPLVPDDGLVRVPAQRDAFWKALESNHADAMIAAHNHLWFKTQPVKTWQIIAGNGGSPLETGVSGKDAYYGFTRVAVSASGSVTLTSHGRDLPSDGYLGKAAAYPTTVRDTVELAWK